MILPETHAIHKKYEKLRTEIDNLEAKKIALQELKKELKESIEKLITIIKNPHEDIVNKYHEYQIRLNEAEINILKPKARTELDAKEKSSSCLLDVMTKLNRYNEYNNLVNQPFDTLDVATMPLLNYDNTSIKINNNSILNILQNWKFITINPNTGAIMDNGSLLSNIFVIISTNKSNIQFGNINFNGVQNNLKGAITKHAQIFPLDVPLEKFRVNLYTIMIGLLPWAAAPGLPSRLEILDDLMPIYDERMKNYDYGLMHHSLFLGDFDTFKKLTGTDVPLASQQKANAVIDFWKDYEIIEKQAKWRGVPFTIAEINVEVDDLDNKLSSLQQELELLKKSMEELKGKQNTASQISPIFIGNVRTSIQDITTQSMDLIDSIKNYEIKLTEIKNYLSILIPELKKIPIDGTTLNQIQQFRNHISDRLSTIIDNINELGSFLNNDLPKLLSQINSSIGGMALTAPNIKNNILNINQNIRNIRKNFPQLGNKLQNLGVPLNEIKVNINML